jgi:hypothetical protein
MLKWIAGFLFLLFAALLPQTAFAVLAVDGSPATGTIASGGSSGTITLSVTTNDIIVVFIGLENITAQGQKSVSNITDTASNNYGGAAYYKKQPGYSTAGTLMSGEIWSAVAGSTASITITVTSSGAVDHGAMVAVAISGANTAAPWDTATPVPFYNSGTGASSVTAVSTIHPHTMVFGFAWTDGNGAIPGSLVAGTGYTIVGNAINTSGGSQAVAVSAQQQIFSTVQPSITVPFDSSVQWQTWNMTAVALTSDVGGAGCTSVKCGISLLLGM